MINIPETHGPLDMSRQVFHIGGKPLVDVGLDETFQSILRHLAISRVGQAKSVPMNSKWLVHHLAERPDTRRDEHHSGKHRMHITKVDVVVLGLGSTLKPVDVAHAFDKFNVNHGGGVHSGGRRSRRHL